MSGQKFAAREPFTFANGATGWAPGGPFDCLGPYAKVQNCPIVGTALLRTVYATGYADTYWSIPARCTIGGRTVHGYFAADKAPDGLDGESIAFYPLDAYRDFLQQCESAIHA